MAESFENLWLATKNSLIETIVENFSDSSPFQLSQVKSLLGTEFKTDDSKNYILTALLQRMSQEEGGVLSREKKDNGRVYYALCPAQIKDDAQPAAKRLKQTPSEQVTSPSRQSKPWNLVFSFDLNERSADGSVVLRQRVERGDFLSTDLPEDWVDVMKKLIDDASKLCAARMFDIFTMMPLVYEILRVSVVARAKEGDDVSRVNENFDAVWNEVWSQTSPTSREKSDDLEALKTEFLPALLKRLFLQNAEDGENAAADVSRVMGRLFSRVETDENGFECVAKWLKSG
jgi:hypothetical protein